MQCFLRVLRTLRWFAWYNWVLTGSQLELINTDHSRSYWNKKQKRHGKHTPHPPPPPTPILKNWRKLRKTYRHFSHWSLCPFWKTRSILLQTCFTCTYLIPTRDLLFCDCNLHFINKISVSRPFTLGSSIFPLLSFTPGSLCYKE